MNRASHDCSKEWKENNGMTGFKRRKAEWLLFKENHSAFKIII